MSLTADDRLEIRTLLARYCHALDAASKDVAAPAPELERAWVDTFTADGVFETPAGAWRGRAELRRFWRTSGQRPPHVRHWINNLVLEGGGDEARGRCYLLVLDVSGAPRIRYVGAYEDRYRRERGAWRIAQRTIRRHATA